MALGSGRLIASILLVAASSLVAFGRIQEGASSSIALGLTALASLAPLVVTYLAVPSMKPAEDISLTRVRLIAPWVALWVLVCWPIVWPLDRLVEYMERRPESKEARGEALMALVEDDSEDGGIEADKVEMITSIMNIGDTTVKEVMVQRVDIVAVERSHPVSEVFALFAETQHSRIPVFEERIDKIVGIVHAKDALQFLLNRGERDPEKIPIDEQFVDEPSSVQFVPATKKIDDLLRDLRREKRHMAVVVDEYGGTAGIVTMEDILEEIVGEIQDEYDNEEEEPYQWLSETHVEIDASMSIDEVNELLGSNLSEEDGYETLAGFLYQKFSAVPSSGAELSYEDFRFTVKTLDAQRIDKVVVERIRDSEERRRQAQGR